MAKKFLYLIAIIIVVILVAMIALRVWSRELTEIALVPSTEFVEQDPIDMNAYQDPDLWYSRPGIGVSDPARWQPAYADPENSDGVEATSSPDVNAYQPAALPDAPDYAVFFIHPTSYLSRDNWNAPQGDEEAERVARLYVRGMASPFNSASEIWAPRYRQATMGAFLTDEAEGQQAIDAAYRDVREAFRFFVSSINEDTPIVLAGHSQGALHLIELLRQEMADSALQQRIVAAYSIGWPISIDHDLPAMGMDACATPSQTGCLLSWSSFAEPADTSDVIEAYANSTGFDGTRRGESQILCTNPLTGTFGGSAEADRNLGTLVPEKDLSDGKLVPRAVPARCDDRGILLIGDPPEMGNYVLPGNNYHVYDIPLFWANTQADVVRRVEAWAAAR
ncbi:MAG: DUF3089 domain-containing protein [Pseudomonadota bacterium]